MVQSFNSFKYESKIQLNFVIEDDKIGVHFKVLDTRPRWIAKPVKVDICNDKKLNKISVCLYPQRDHLDIIEYMEGEHNADIIFEKYASHQNLWYFLREQVTRKALIAPIRRDLLLIKDSPYGIVVADEKNEQGATASPSINKHFPLPIKVLEEFKDFHQYLIATAGHQQKMLRQDRLCQFIKYRGIQCRQTRSKLWPKFVGATEYHRNAACGGFSPLYAKLRVGEVPAKDARSIKLDMHRTYPGYQFFSGSNSPGQIALKHVLTAYCVMQHKIGYVQGMAFIAGFLLFHLDEESAFWTFMALMSGNTMDDKFGFSELFCHGLGKYVELRYCILKILKELDPQLNQFLEDLYISPDMYASQFIMSLCTNNFQFSVTTQIWDVFLLEGWRIIIKIIVGLLIELREEIMYQTEASTIVPLIVRKCNFISFPQVVSVMDRVRLSRTMYNQYKHEYEAHNLSREKLESLNKTRLQNEALKLKYETVIHESQHTGTVDDVDALLKKEQGDASPGKIKKSLSSIFSRFAKTH